MSTSFASSTRRDFEPDFVPSLPSTLELESALTESCTALARFEFESGRGNEGTKILMVEWEAEDETPGTTAEGGSSQSNGEWEVSWEGKSTTLNARDGAEGNGNLRRLYFLLPPGTSIPRVVSIARKGGKCMQVAPLPAIFPVELGISARSAGKKGVLHTIYAKKRLSVLQKEIETEMKTNGEGVGLEIAMQEKQWLEDNFGVVPKLVTDLQSAASPTSPKSPGGGRLSEKLKGLKLGTSASELRFVTSDHHVHHDLIGPSAHPLSPNAGDVAVSSFSLFHSGGSARPQPRIVAQSPPSHLAARQGDSRSGSRINSLDAVASGKPLRKEENETEDGLFAVKLSPRSPEMTKSPFSFTSAETAPWLKGKDLGE